MSTEPSKRRRLTLPGPYDLGRSLLLADLGRSNPTARRPSPEELHRATPTVDGPASFRLQVERGAGAVEVEAWGPGREVLLDSLERVLGLDDELPRLPGKIGRLQRRFPGVRLGRAPDLFTLLASYVLRQRVAWRDAVASEQRLLRAHASPAPGPLELRLPLSPDQWLGLSTADFAGFGVERKRAKTVLGLAARARQIERFARELPSAEFGRKLELFTGVGPWTRAWVQGLVLGDGDAVPLGDYDLPSSVAWFLAGEARASDERMLELLAPYAGQRFRVIHLLWASGQKAPRFGHRIRGPRL